jgi:hypothetical protein
VVRGGPNDIGNWPVAFAEQPANRRIVRSGASGPGKVLEDNGSSIDASLAEYSGSVSEPTPQAGGSTSTSGSAGKGPVNPPSNAAAEETSEAGGGGGCSFSRGPSGATALLLAGALGLLFGRRPRRR